METPAKTTNCPFCTLNNLTTITDVGWDIDEDGEEKQHIDRCDCGAWRFNIERWNNDGTYKRYFGKWHPKSDPRPE